MSLYLDLLMKSVLGELYLENEVRLLYLRACAEGRDVYEYRTLLEIGKARAADCAGYEALALEGRLIGDRLENLGFQHSMIGRRRMENVARCLGQVLEDGVPGDLMECGVWRGGTCIFMRGFLAEYGIADRTVWVADSFQGPPPPSLSQDMDDDLSAAAFPMLAIPLETVRDAFARYGLLDSQVRFLPGWFRDTLSRAPIERLALLRLDGDLYESTRDALAALYDKVSPGGFIIVDDYNCIPACRQATDEFRAEHGVSEPLQVIDWTGIYWRKS